MSVNENREDEQTMLTGKGRKVIFGGLGTRGLKRIYGKDM